MSKKYDNNDDQIIPCNSLIEEVTLNYNSDKCDNGIAFDNKVSYLHFKTV